MVTSGITTWNIGVFLEGQSVNRIPGLVGLLDEK